MKKPISAQELTEMSQITEEKVAQTVKILIEAYNPIKIYAFGSYARGTFYEESDFDVMVVIDSYQGKKPWEVISYGHEKLFDIFMPVDLLVYDLKNFETCKNDPTSFCSKIIKTGKLMYARKDS